MIYRVDKICGFDKNKAEMIRDECRARPAIPTEKSRGYEKARKRNAVAKSVCMTICGLSSAAIIIFGTLAILNEENIISLNGMKNILQEIPLESAFHQLLFMGFALIPLFSFFAYLNFAIGEARANNQICEETKPKLSLSEEYACILCEADVLGLIIDISDDDKSTCDVLAVYLDDDMSSYTDSDCLGSAKVVGSTDIEFDDACVTLDLETATAYIAQA